MNEDFLKNKFKKDYDAVVLVFSVLNRLYSGKVNSFSERLRSQKVQYFAQTFLVSPAYIFNLYLRGPYSSALADDLYNIKRMGLSAPKNRFVPNELEDRFDKLNDFLKLMKNNKQLELCSTLHWLMFIAKQPEAQALRNLKMLKDASSEEVSASLGVVKKIKCN